MKDRLSDSAHVLQDPEMSMLAEPRRKQKWSVDPRNSAWSKDDSKFGQKMLERMGWSKGKGLGKSEQGATEHIKVKVKNNSLGLGTAINNEDNWIAHQDDFNQLLADLNNCHGQKNTDELSSEQTHSFSLEEKSKTSKKRVHYMKFTKGKDLSSRSQTDLACIFGKRQLKNQDEESNGTDSLEEKEPDSDDKASPSNPDVEVNTVTSTLSMQEYFAQRMARLKNSRTENRSLTSASETNGNPHSLSIENSPNTSDTDESRKKKKKKKKDRKDDNEEKVEIHEDASVTGEITSVEQVDADSKKKKKKKKKKGNGLDDEEEDPVEECCVPAAKEETLEDIVEVSTHKKKKRKNKVTSTHVPTDSTNEDDEADKISDTGVSNKKLKKRKQREQPEGIKGKRTKKKED